MLLDTRLGEHPRPVPAAGLPFLKPSEARDTPFLLSYMRWRQTADGVTRGRVVGGAKSDRKLGRREGMEDLWRPDRGEVRGDGQRLLRRVWWRWRSEVTVLRLVLLKSKAGIGCCASWRQRVDWPQPQRQRWASGNCDQQAALCQHVLVPQLDFETQPYTSHHSTPSYQYSGLKSITARNKMLAFLVRSGITS